MPTEPYHDFPLSDEYTWNASSAEQGLRKWASSDGSGDKEKINWNKLQQAYFWHETGTLSDFGQLKFPYCRIESGDPHVVHNAVQNALVRIDRSSIPAGDKSKVRAVAQKQMDRFGDSSDNGNSQNSLSFNSGQSMVPTDEQMAKINAMTRVSLSPDEVYVHKYLMIGTDFIPSRNMRFDRSLMDIYLQNLKSGDVVQIADHSFESFPVGNVTLPYGRFFDGEIQEDGQGNEQLIGDMYMVAGMPTYVNGITTDDIHKQLNAGILKDSSVGVTWGFSECSICHNDIRNYSQCKHWPGKTYEVEGEDGVIRTQKCIVIAKPNPNLADDSSHILENSDVVAGAYPAAKVLSEGSMSEVKGKKQPLRLNNIADLKLVKEDTPVFCYLSSSSATFKIERENLRDASELHQMQHEMYRMNELPDGWTKAKLCAEHKKSVQEILDSGGEHFMQDALDGALNDALKARSKKGSEYPVTDDEKLAFEQEITELKKFLTDKDGEIASLKEQVEQLTVNAELGVKYREDVIEGALASGVRDQGNEFKEDMYKKMFAGLSIDEIKEMGEAWEHSALEKLGVVQHVQGDDLNLPGHVEDSEHKIDPNLYRVGR